MASRYWRAGTGTWNSTNTTNWSTTSGGSGGASVPGASDTVFFDANSGGAPVVTWDATSASSVVSIDCTGFTGTLATGGLSKTLSGTGTVWSSPVTCTITGAPTLTVSSTGSTAITVICNHASPSATNAPNFSFTGGTYALTCSGNGWRNIIFTGFAGSIASGTNPTSYGNITLSTGGTFTAHGPTMAATGTFTSLGKTISGITVNAAGGTVTLADAMTAGTSNITTLTAGTLALAGFTLSTGIFSSSNSNTRAISFSTGNIALTSTGVGTTNLSMADATNFTYTGTGSFTRVSSAISTVVFGTTSGSTTNAPNYTVSSGSSNVAMTNGSWFKVVSFAGMTGGSVIGAVNLAGNLTVNPGVVWGGFFVTFRDTASFNLVGAIGFGSIAVDGAGITVTLSNTGTNNPVSVLSLAQGTLNITTNLNSNSFSSSNSNVRALTLTAGIIFTISGSGASAWNTATSTNLTFTPNTATISMTSASAKTFAGGDLAYYNLNQGGAGALTISGSNTFNNIINTVQPNTVTFTAGTTQTVFNFGLSGTAGNLITINSSSAGSQFTLSKASGIVTGQYLSIQDSNATGGATWSAGGSSSLGNNTGWAITADFRRYWVGGTGNWTTTSTTNWSPASGGTGGASVPTASNSVFFDQAGPYTVSMGLGGGTLTCLDFTVSGASVTFAASASHNLYVYGSFTLDATTVWNQSWGISFQATTTGKTITTNGVQLPISIGFDGVGGGWTLGSALNISTGTIAHSAGTFNTDNYTLSCGNFTSSTSSVRAINLGSSTFNIGLGSLNFNNQTNLTFNAGTSTINFGAFAGGASSWTIQTGVTFYNVAYPAGTGAKSITGTNTFNNLTIAGPAAAGTANLTFAANQTINGTLSTTGTAGNSRVFFASATYGIGFTLTCNSAPSLTDADFRDLYVKGTAAPISGTRIGNRGNCSGITFSTPKTVYWNLAGNVSWESNAWATAPGNSPNTDNFPLAQDTAVIDNSTTLSVLSILGSTTLLALPTIDFSNRTTSLQIVFGNSPVCYGSLKMGSGIVITGSGNLTFSGGNTHTITSAGKTFSCPITVDTYGGTVQLADALNIGANTLTVTNGTFTTAGYAVTADALSSSNSNVRTINLNASTISLGSYFPWNTTATNLTFNAGTSTINCTSSIPAISAGGLTFYNFAFTSSSVGGSGTSIFGTNIYNNLTITGRTSVGVGDIQIGSNQTINGTLTINSAGSGATFRQFLRSSTIGTQRTLTVNSLSANDCDFRDIVIAGAASGTAPTRAGNCGNNSGITFPTAKTVYWNLAGTQNWSATGWCTASGGTPAVSNFPLAQDTAVFNNAGSITTVSVDAIWNIGTLDASARTSAMTFSSSLADTSIYGDLKLGSGVTTTGFGTLAFFKFGTQTITCNGASLNLLLGPASPNTVLQLADAFTSSNGIAIGNGGTFDSANFNVTISTFTIVNVSSVLKMGTSTWTITSAQLWSWDTSITSSTIFAGQSNIVFSNNSTTARGFVAASSQYYNKITIGGSAISTFVIQGALVLGELASTKTTAHTITLYSSTTYNIGKWSVTGTVGNVVTVQPETAATVYTLNIIGPANTGIDYLSISYCAVSTSSLGEFYVGANSTNVLGNSGPIIFTATPSPSTRYWRGGTGTWNATNTTSWASASGGAGPASVPTSVDTVIFDSASNATAYTVTVSTAAARCGTLIIGGPAAGNLTINSSAGIPLIAHGDVRFAATGVISTSMSGGIVLSGSATNQPFVSDVLVVGGGGAGGHLGGGGAGGHRYFTNESLVANTNYTVTVGLGGAASTGATGNQGLNSVFNTYTSAGGGGGAGEAALPAAGGSGGGGGGLAGTSRPGAAGNTPSTSPSQGNAGGNGNDNGAGTAFAGGGGGGAGGTGNNAPGTTTAGNGGVGTATTITGSSVTRAAGGGGGAYQISGTGTAGTGGSSIGGNGGHNGLNATSGSPNTGSGGGGNGLNASGNLQGSSGAGGSGVVIIKYLDNLTISNPGGGLTFTTDSASVAGYKITTFTNGTGQISFNATTSRLFTTNGVALTAGIQINGVGCGWTLGSSLNIGSNTLTVTNGTFSTSASNYSVTFNTLSSSNSNVRTINLNGSTVNAAGTSPVAFTNYINHTFNAGTSTIDCSSGFPTFSGGGLTYYNVSFTSPVTNPIISGANTFNNLFITGRTGVGCNVLFINNANQTINGTFTVSAGTTAACRTFIITGSIGTAITLTCAAVSLADVDFRDITIAGVISSITFNIAGAQTWTVPAGVTSATIKLWGAGGGSGGNGYIEGGGGGGGGAFASKVLTVTPAQVLSFTVGTGGGAGGYNGFGQTVGATGTASTHSTITAGGGLGGGDGVGGAGGTASGGDVNTSGQAGIYAGTPIYSNGGLAGNSPNTTAASAVAPYSGLQPGGGQRGGGTDFTGKGGDGRVTFEWSAISLPVTGTRLGDCKGNSGITFPAAKTVYYGQTGSADWGATGSGSWSATLGGTLDATMFPLAQDTAVFPADTYPTSGSTTTINQAYNTGTIVMSLRTSNTMTLAINTNGTGIYGNWINGTGITISGTGTISFPGRTTQTITSVGRSFTQPIQINSPSGSVTLQDALTTDTTVATTLTAGTLNLNNFTLTTGTFVSSGSVAKTITFGSGTIGVYSTGTVWNMGTVTINKGTGTILLGNTSTTGRTFAGGGLSYPKLSIGGATGISTLTITGNNTFAEITSTKTVANTISLGTTTQTVEAWTATGTASNLLTITGTSAASPATLILTGAIKPNVDYSAITGVRAYPLADTWYALTSTNNGSLGFIYNAELAAIVKKLYLGGSNTLSVYYGSKPVNSIYYGSVKIFG